MSIFTGPLLPTLYTPVWTNSTLMHGSEIFFILAIAELQRMCTDKYAPHLHTTAETWLANVRNDRQHFLADIASHAHHSHVRGYVCAYILTSFTRLGIY